MEAVGNYDAYYQKVQELCEEFGISYYDFNLANPSILKMEDNVFRDANHLNGTGAEKVTRVFADFFAGKIEKEELFYDSYAEKKEHLPKRFIGVILKRSKDKKICSIPPLPPNKTTTNMKYMFRLTMAILLYCRRNRQTVKLLCHPHQK